MEKERKIDTALLARAMECHRTLAGFRRQRGRCKRFTFGDQWSDRIDMRGISGPESEMLFQQGNLPLTNNLIRRLVRNVLGVYRNRWSPPRCSVYGDAEGERVLNALLADNVEENRMQELFARTLEEFLISGLAVHKKWYGRRGGTVACRTDQVRPDNFFFDTCGTDVRGHDIVLAGEVHRVRYEDLAAMMARDGEELEDLREVFQGGGGEADARRECEVWEIWERHQSLRAFGVDRASGRIFDGRRSGGDSRRWSMHEEWRYSFLASTGHVLRSGVSPYPHGSHPYVMKAYPYIDGEIHSFVGDVIDQQKLTNRLVTMYDWILRASAKGVLLFPEGALPDGVDMCDIADEWSRFNGVIVYRPRAGMPLPQQVSSKSADIGITELLEIQMKMMEDITGVNGALQGKLDNNSMSGTLYDQQTRNSMTALADLLQTYDDFVREGIRKDIANLRRYGGPRSSSAQIKVIFGSDNAG